MIRKEEGKQSQWHGYFHRKSLKDYKQNIRNNDVEMLLDIRSIYKNTKTIIFIFIRNSKQLTAISFTTYKSFTNHIDRNKSNISTPNTIVAERNYRRPNKWNDLNVHRLENLILIKCQTP